jgi:hypothetical protein
MLAEVVGQIGKQLGLSFGADDVVGRWPRSSAACHQLGANRMLGQPPLGIDRGRATGPGGGLPSNTSGFSCARAA